jgi:quinol-cytochrome oxidoreductase complex cytochrome b subunit
MPKLDIARLRKGFLAALGVEVVVLAGSGVYLLLFYQPTIGSHIRPEDLIRDVHRVDAWMTIATSALFAVVVAASASRTRHRTSQNLWPLEVLAGVGSCALAVLGWISGRLLPWDQLALTGITFDTNVRGYRLLRGHRLRFAMIDNRELTGAALQHRLVLHGLVGLALALLLILAWWPVRRRSSPPALAPQGTTAVQDLAGDEPSP